MGIAHYEGARLRPRTNIEDVSSASQNGVASSSSIFRRLVTRENCQDTDSCAAASANTNLVVPIVVAIVVPIVLIAIFLYYLHRKNMKRQMLEDANDPHKSLDFGLDGAGGKKSARRSLFMGGGEKGLNHKPSQLSMDMNLSSPYLLPPGLQESRESLNSLAKSLGNDNQDPYQYVATITQSETGSLRSFNPKDSLSHNTKFSSPRNSGKPGSMKMPPSRMNSLPETPVSATDSKVDPFGTPKAPAPTHQPNSHFDEKDGFQPTAIIPEIGVVSDFDEKRNGASVQPPPAVRSKTPEFELPNFSSEPANDFPLPPAREHEATGLGLNFSLPQPKSPTVTSPDAPKSAPLPHDRQSDGSNYQSYTPAADISSYYEDHEDDSRGRTMQRTSFVEDTPQYQGLGVPQQDNKRLSVGFRPLPPDEITESEDPEYRANRIRSFYKEYFEDTKEAPPPMPPMPPMAQGRAGPQYYEDVDQGYMMGGDQAYFDPETNAFVMPYAQPVTRRAMTPPPAGRRPGPGRPGPRPRGPNGSIGGMSYQSGPGGRSRAGSALGPRPDSSASARIRQPPRKRLPPPAPLTTLPTPSKLKDDNIALINAADFAPPNTIRDTAAGRSQSPFGERRPYSPSVPAAQTLVSPFEELTALPSPHLLRKSSTFTGLDFAPPKRFKDSDTMSDAGSIRSNRSGMSQAQLGAIRGGAGRVSRLPGDQVFTQQALQDTLKPSWGIRP
ncbi:hypothetical protein RAB80_000379 [Fusarium oxysporum f. sp. vasinfectum]|uniref:Uncharacterized protein n=1 Tax=Fusarium oxysporum f. sp. vasinfectum 25433 TaxID=1089449 RepID=X0M709_FUSOX|nr:hypothetical protein FOTG_05365 [Fusarium oxysporum f. sp. vasinfectum 25433]EXM29157.1 hypothetical protein FOTG_05365 [Fusarium oxysporum f. sp. vasinfectum 25433]KAK2682433.1 hypothetical protein RAB80_000379 [Fusarium oxysporum f. sp. vasinfectum]KAK2938300.1 hypothetical protein FoTM2_001518 [Fusarium oxysporum f. sp. vasinfectum]